MMRVGAGMTGYRCFRGYGTKRTAKQKSIRPGNKNGQGQGFAIIKTAWADSCLPDKGFSRAPDRPDWRVAQSDQQ